MIRTPLTYYERVMCWNWCGLQQVASLREAATYIRLIEKLRPTDAEMRETQFATTEQGFKWNVPQHGYGNKVVNLEDSEAEALKATLEAQQNIRVSDAEWMLRLTESLTPVEVPA